MVITRRSLTALLIVAAMAVGCDRSSDSSPEESNPDTAYLLGLNRNHELRYIVYDSIVTVSPDSMTVTLDTTVLDIAVTRGSGNEVELAADGLPHDLLTVDPSGVLHSGQIRPAAMPPDTLFFYPTPVIMPRFVVTGSTWSSQSPPYRQDGDEIRRTFLYLTYGFFTERRYVGRVDLILPTSSYSTYHFRSALFDDESSLDTLMTIDEYYASGVGPVKLLSRFDRSRRLIILLDDR